MPNPNENAANFLIDDVFPHPDIHLFCGSSGSGKTTFLIQMLSTWSRGEKWFGHESYPRPFVYISGERSRRNVERTFKRLGVKTEGFTLVGSTELAKGITFNSAINAVLAKKPDAKLIVVEGITRFIPGGKVSDVHIVLNFLVDAQRFCESKGVSFIFVTWPAKEREGERVLNLREKAMGSVAFGGCSETIVYLEPCGGRDEGMRSVAFLKKNAKDEFYHMRFAGENGILEQIDSPNHTGREISDYILAFDHGFRFSPEDITFAFPSASEKTIRIQISRLLHSREVVRLYKGSYKRLKSGEIHGLPGVN